MHLVRVMMTHTRNGSSLAVIVLCAGASVAACGERPKYVNTSMGSTLTDDAREIASGARERVNRFRDQQFSYMDQLSAALEDATSRGNSVEADMLRADLGEAQIASMDDWSSLKAQLDRDLDGAVKMRTAVVRGARTRTR
jgi:hypothetical protein